MGPHENTEFQTIIFPPIKSFNFGRFVFPSSEKMIRALIYSKGKVREEFDLHAIAKAAAAKSNTVWVDVDAPKLAETEELVRAFKLHELSVEDAQKTNQRPKVEVYPNYAFVVVRSFKAPAIPAGAGQDYEIGQGETDLVSGKTTQLNFFLGDNWIITHSLDNATTQEVVYEKAKKNPYLLSLGADYILYAVMDATVDDYFPLFNAITEKLDCLEDEVLGKPTNATLSEALRLKRLLFAFRKEVQPLRDVAGSLSRREVRFVADINAPYYRDTYDHLVRLLDNVEMNRDMVTNVMEAYLSSVSNTLNKSMKRVAAISTILMPPALLAGIFGMNFHNMPETELESGFYILLAVMAVMIVGTTLYFRKEDWL